MATTKECYTLISYFERAFNNKYHEKPRNVNQYAARWGFDAMLQGKSMDEVKSLIDYYLTTASPRRHDLNWFFYNYDKLADAKDVHEKDAELRQKIRADSAERAAKWKERIGNQGIASN